nr:g-type lectin s-receptor-like serine/threonine-protein kinase lecrk3 [Quercus suber]
MFFACGRAEKKQFSHVQLGSALHPETPPMSWRSPSGHFEFGFYQQGNGFMVGIWLVGINNITVVWTARRDDPPVTRNATLNLTKDGLFLITEQGLKHISARTSDSAYFAANMLDSGNFVLYNKNNSIIWETFSYPTDTILGGQFLSSGGQLFSNLSETNQSTGRYRLKMQYDGNLVLYPVNTVDVSSDAYWSSGTYENVLVYYRLYLNNTGLLHIINSTGNSVEVLSSSSASNNITTIYRATLEFNGFFRLYSHTYNETGTLNSSVIEWYAVDDLCKVKGFCGFNSFCTLNDGKPYCLCLPGTDFIDANHTFLGCESNFLEVGCKGGREFVESYNIYTTENMIWEDIPFMDVPTSTKEECRNSCLEDCNCGAALFIDSQCQKQKLPLRYVRRDSYNQTIAFFKVGLISIKSWNESDQITPVHVFTSKKILVHVLVLILGFTAFSFLALGISGLFMFKIRVLRKNMDVNVSKPEEIVLSTWVYNCFVARDLDKIVGNEEVDKRTLENMVKVALWRIQDEPILRPSMKSVVLMLEGITDVAVPPCPTSAST